MVLEQLMIHYGWTVNPQEGAARAHRYAMKAAKMSGQWVSYDEMAECWLVFLVKRRHITQFNKSWQDSEQWLGQAP